MIARFLGAVQFLTIIPVRAETALPGQCALFFPLVGALAGAAAGLLLQHAPSGAVLVLIFLVLLGGGLHEDGLADIFDALRSYRTRDTMLRILKDSRIGAHGAMALTLSLVLRWQALSGILVDPVPALAASQAIPRAALVALAWTSRPVPGGSGAYLCATMTSSIALGAIFQGAAFAAFLGWKLAILSIGGSVLLLRVLWIWFHARLGGINGDCLGATAVIIECYVFVLFACQRCTS